MHLDRLIVVLEAVAVAGRPVSARDVQHTTGLPRPTCYRLLQSLTQHHLLDETEQSSRYQIGDRLKQIAFLGQTDIDVCQAAAPELKATAIEFGEAVFLSRLRDTQVEIIHVETPTNANRSFIHPGLGHRPMHACSCSKAIAAFAADTIQQEILAKPLRAYTDHTKTAPALLEEEFETIRKRGFAECVEEIEVGVSSVAAPIRIHSIGASFSIGATGPIRRFQPGYRQKIGERLIEVALKVSATLELHGKSQAA